MIVEMCLAYMVAGLVVGAGIAAKAVSWAIRIARARSVEVGWVGMMKPSMAYLVTIVLVAVFAWPVALAAPALFRRWIEAA